MPFPGEEGDAGRVSIATEELGVVEIDMPPEVVASVGVVLVVLVLALLLLTLLLLLDTALDIGSVCALAVMASEFLKGGLGLLWVGVAVVLLLLRTLFGVRFCDDAPFFARSA